MFSKKAGPVATNFDQEVRKKNLQKTDLNNGGSLKNNFFH